MEIRRAFGVDVVRRAGWGADESYRFDTSPAATVRAIYRDQAVTQTWGDIGYQLLIDRNGTIYEGRLAHLTGLDPLGTTNYVNPISGATKTVPAIAAHREWSATACPGDAFYPHLPGVRQDVAAYLERFRREHS